MSELSIFESEEKTIERAKTFLEQEEHFNAPLYEPFGQLLKDYKKLLKVAARTVKINDKQQKQIRDKNETLETVQKNLAKFLSPQVYERIFSGQHDAHVKSERKKLTIFFSDIVNFTQTTEQLQSEDLTSLLNNYLNEMSSIAIKHGGTIDKFIGDAIMVFFGAPESRGPKKDALACVSMALDMQNALEDMQKSLYEKGIIEPFQARMGVSTGYCTVGNFGSEKRMDYTIIGSLVNLAARLEGAAAVNQILISHETQSLISDDIFCKKKDAIFVKGIHYPIQTYLVVDHFKNIKKRTEINKEFDGFSVYVDVDEINNKKKKEEAIHSLQETIRQLEEFQ